MSAAQIQPYRVFISYSRSCEHIKKTDVWAEVLRILEALGVKLADDTAILLKSLDRKDTFMLRLAYLTNICRTTREMWPPLVLVVAVAEPSRLESVLTSLKQAKAAADRARKDLLEEVELHPAARGWARDYIVEYHQHLEQRCQSACTLLDGTIADVRYDLLKSEKSLPPDGPPAHGAPLAVNVAEKCALLAEVLANTVLVLSAVRRELLTESGPPPECFDDMAKLTASAVRLLAAICETQTFAVKEAADICNQWKARLQDWQNEVVLHLKNLFDTESDPAKSEPRLWQLENPASMKRYLQEKLDLPLKRTMEMIEQARLDAAQLDALADPKDRGQWRALLCPHLVPHDQAGPEERHDVWRKMQDNWNCASFEEYSWWLDHVRKKGLPDGGLADAAALRLVHSLLRVHRRRALGPLEPALVTDSPALQRGSFQLAVAGALRRHWLAPAPAAQRSDAGWFLGIAQIVIQTPPGDTPGRYQDFHSQCSLGACLTALYILIPLDGGPDIRDEWGPLQTAIKKMQASITTRFPAPDAGGEAARMRSYFNQFLLDDLKPLRATADVRPHTLQVLRDGVATELCWRDHTAVLDLLQNAATVHACSQPS